ncbi:apoptosis-resistant E3 ubiquitin protein ligase 1-like [Pollicipes pollicipes]|uniref:apoptosis-resistant E3 ubiquitin protein ligase 1-like n=1 Tax=Pollicipes pollicipes TaxID=41117 RepID=UPI001884A747|nr:apoptosis-resistant E3 ubiquitin protein ligase 1-like [Pollicipes pollicipes]
MKIWICITCIVIYNWWFKSPPWNSAVSKWLSDQGLSIYEQLFSQHGIRHMLDLADAHALPVISGPDGQRLLTASHQLYERLVFRFWLAQVHHDDKAERLEAVEVWSLDDLLEHSDPVLRALPGMVRAVAKLPSDPAALAGFKRQLFDEMKAAAAQPKSSSWVTLRWMLVAVCVVFLGDLGYRLWRDAGGRRALSEPVRRLLLLAVRCRVELQWQDRRRVGGTVSLHVEAKRLDGAAYDLEGGPIALQVLVHVRGAPVACAVERRDGSATCTFPARTAGTYAIGVTLGGRHVAGSPFLRVFRAGLPDAETTTLLSHSSMVVMTQGQPYPMTVDLRDGFNNPCEPSDWAEIRPRLAVSVSELDGARPVEPYEQWDLEGRRVSLRLVLSREGCFRANITHGGTTIRNGHFFVIVLSAYNMSAVRKHVQSRGVTFSARLMCVDERPLNKPKDVWCSVSPKQLTVHETMLLFLRRKLYTFRLCPSTRLTPTNERNTASMPSLLVSDGCQPALELTLKDRDTMAATFTRFLLRNVGGSETFADKRRHFYRELERQSGGGSRRPLPLTVRRAALLDSSMAALRGASDSDWGRPFEVRFDDEEALDYGGVRREWFELVCQALFEPRGRLFVTLDDSSQALVHPNHRRPPALRLRHFVFAGRVVGKCLLESSQGGATRQLVRANFTRSFLSQLIGLRVSYKHFEQDDRELYRTKIATIEACSAAELAAFELTFVDEEFDDRGRLAQTVELRSGGARTPVTVDNRLEYLQALAQYRLSTRVRAEVEAFLRGLNDLVPDQLLSIFDENELELLMCGSSEFSVAELRNHHTVTDHTSSFEKVIRWFWTALENFSAEETSRLLQFTTGCARLPAGGFAELVPKFQISSYPEFGALPVAHTCFNQICLADHATYQDFERALLLALREGNVGFGLL